jgi:hypothetical protein
MSGDATNQELTHLGPDKRCSPYRVIILFFRVLCKWCGKVNGAEQAVAAFGLSLLGEEAAAGAQGCGS